MQGVLTDRQRGHSAAPPVLGLFLRAVDNPYQELIRAEAHARARAHGYTVREVSAKNDADRQVAQVQESLEGLTQATPRALFVNPVRESALHLVARQASRRDVAWVMLNRTSDFVRELRREAPGQVMVCVDVNQQEVGRLQGRQFRALLPNGGEVLYLLGPAATSSARLRLSGVEREIAGTSIRLTLRATDWTEEAGASATMLWLESLPSGRETATVIGAQNDTMAVGAARALSDFRRTRSAALYGLTEVPITGCDGVPSHGQRLVHEGQLAATVVIPATSGVAVDLVLDSFDGKATPQSDLVLEVHSFPDVGALVRPSGKRR
jgi:ABC-type sugar transport system substrate-binding protein